MSESISLSEHPLLLRISIVLRSEPSLIRYELPDEDLLLSTLDEQKMPEMSLLKVLKTIGSCSRKTASINATMQK